MHRVGRFVSVAVPAPALAAAAWGQPGALERGSLGLYEAGELKAVDGRCADCTPKAALWYFEGDLVAIPKQSQAAPASFSRQSVVADVREWAQRESAATACVALHDLARFTGADRRRQGR